MVTNKKAQNKLSFDNLGMPLCINYTIPAEIIQRVYSHINLQSYFINCFCR